MNLIMMKGSITLVIYEAITYSYNTINYIKLLEEQLLRIFKSLASTFIIKMITMKYNDHSGVYEHIVKMSDMASQFEVNRHDNF